MTTLYQSNEDRGNIFGEVEKTDKPNNNPGENFPRNDFSKSYDLAEEFKLWRQRFQDITSQMRQAPDLVSLVKVTVAEVRDKIGGDRTLIYQFINSEVGTVLAESRTSGWTPCLGENLPAILFGLYTNQDYIEPVAIDDINQVQVSPYQKQLLDKFQVQASLSLPIFIDGEVWGLLVIHNCGSEREWEESEITLLAQITTEITYRLDNLKLQKELQQSVLAKQSTAKVISKVLQQPDVNKVFATTTQEVRKLLKCDRVTVYRFNSDWSGEFVAESVGGNWLKILTPDFQAVWEDTRLQETKGGRYAQGETLVVNDIYAMGFEQFDLEILEQLEAKAYMIAPIFSGEKIWGLLAVYQNTGVREWQNWESSFLTQIGSQFGIAISQGESIETARKQSEQLLTINKIVSQIRQSLDVESLFKTATQELRQLLKCDRTAIYQFYPDWGGEFVAESVASGWVKLVGADFKTVLNDPCLQEKEGGRYQKGDALIVNDIYQTTLDPCYIEIIEKYEARAYIITPILVGNRLWGLIAAYQNSDIRKWQESEVNLLSRIGDQLGLALQQSEYLQQLQNQSHQLTEIAEQEKAISKIVNRIRQSSEVEEIFKIATQEVRQLLKCDRTAIYQFYPDWGGEFVAESVASGWVKLVGADFKTVLNDPCLQEKEGGRYQKGDALIVNDIYTTTLDPCYIEIIEKYQARAYIITPIVLADKLWGLIAAYQNSGTRAWQESEVNVLSRIGNQLGLALQQIEYLQQLQNQSYQLTEIAEQEKAISKIVNRIRQSSEVEEIFKIATQEVRQLLKCDRSAIYQFYPDWGGEFVAESVVSGWVKLVGNDFKTVLNDPCLQDKEGGRYKKGDALIVNDIYKTTLDPCYIEIIEKYEARAYIITPIVLGDKLWGLIAAYQNSGTRAWQESEVNVLSRIGNQLGLALQQSEYLHQLQNQSHQLAEIAEQEKAISKIVNRIRQSSDIEEIFKIATQEMRQLLKCDRSAIYQFYPDWGGEFVAESVVSGWVKLVGNDFKTVLNDPCLQDKEGGRYKKGDALIVNDIYKTTLDPCYIEIIEKYEARAYIITPIVLGDKLWGLIAAYQNSGTRVWQESEVNALSRIGNQVGLALQQIEYLHQLQNQSHQLAEIAEQEKTISKIVNRIRQSVDVEEIFKTTTQEIRQLLKCDRSAIYQFYPDWGGEFVAESVVSGWVKLVGTDFKTVLNDPCLQEKEGGRYQKGDALIVNDIYQTTLDPCYIEIIEKYEARAYIITPILFGDKLWGLIAAYQNSGTREWQESEINVLSRIGDQLGLALQQLEYLKELQTKSSQLADAAEKEKSAKELLQQRSMQLLRAISPALRGDLTVRAPITEDELGTIADAYNGTLQALKQIVVQVQGASQQVAQTSIDSSSSLEGLTDLAKTQSEEIAQALEDIQQMVDSTQAVVSNAQLVQVAVQQANKTVDSGDTAMNQTVNAIQAIRETVAQTSKKIKRLSESSQKISKVVNLISNFASQTNVLALNAAIEATRAGEYGKGFAVVADEVRSLSRQSSAATIEIEKLVQEIQAETGEVAVAMETGIQQVVEGTNLVSETRQNLNAIVAATEEISQLIDRITEATQKQMEQSVTVTTSMNDVANIANKTFGESQEIAAVFQNLSAMAQELLTTASKFKVN